MMEQLDLLTYPQGAGWKRAGTSRDAAKAITPRAPTLRDRVLALLQADAYTADECAERLNVTVLACRPRLSELSRMGLIYDTGLTSKNASGVRASIWRAWA